MKLKLQSYIPLPRQNPKLLIPTGPAKLMAASFLLYPPASRKGKLFKKVAVAAARLGLFPLILNRSVKQITEISTAPAIEPILCSASLTALEETWRHFFNIDQIFLALSLGTPDGYQKVTAIAFDADGEIQGLAKIGASTQAKQLIEHEYGALKFLKHLPLSEGLIPKPLAFGETCELTWLLQSALKEGRGSPLYIREFHLSFLADLATQTKKSGPLRKTHFWKNLAEGLSKNVSASPLPSHLAGETAFIANLYGECRNIIEQTADIFWPLTAVHGDFAPWNIRVIDGRAAVYDWENFLPLAPAGWDVLYHEVRVEHLVKKQPLSGLFARFCTTNQQNDPLTAWEIRTGIKIPSRRLLALLLFADLCSGSSRKAIAERKIPLDLFPTPD